MPAFTEPSHFHPPRLRGLLLHSGIALLLLAAAGTALYFAFGVQVGSYFILLVTVAILLLLPLPLVVYRGYALLHAGYSLERDGLRLRWGLRGEDIPLTHIEWLRPASELGFKLPGPSFSFPGAVLGTRQVDGLGLVDFLASEEDTLLLVATPEKVFAISPSDQKGFQSAFQRALEMGSIQPIPQVSTLPAALLRLVWADGKARWLLIAGLVLTLLLFVIVAVLIPALGQVSLGWSPARVPAQPGPPERLLLLPLLVGFTFVMDLLGGLFLYRKGGNRPVAYLLWNFSILTPLVMLWAVALLVI